MYDDIIKGEKIKKVNQQSNCSNLHLIEDILDQEKVFFSFK